MKGVVVEDDVEVPELDFVDIVGVDIVEEGPFEFTDEDWLLYALLTDPVYMPELLWRDPHNREYGGCYRVRDYQYRLNRCAENYAIFACARSVGKALPLDAPILTPKGWSTMGDLHPGDEVVGSDGLPLPILAEYEQGERDIYAVRFGDGTVVECDDEHLWTVTCDSWQARDSGPRTLPLRELRKRRTAFKVPLVAPVQFAARAKPTQSPWLIGALLGDGNLTRPTMIRFATIDPEMVARVRREIGGDAELMHDGGPNYRIRAREKTPGRQLAYGLLRWSRDTGFHGKAAHEKRIPDEYLWGSVTTRLEVLRGLVDTDGSITHAGSVEICTSSEGLAADIRHVALSLGGRASVTRAGAWLGGVRHRDRYRVVLRVPNMVPCWLPRKVASYKAATASRTRDCDWRRIDSIGFVGRRQAKCIKVSAADGLFVVDGFVLTHNTESEKVHAQIHGFDGDSEAENMLITAPELIHLLPLVDAIEENIRDCRLLSEMLEVSGGQTGFTHRPFGVNWIDGTKLVGRIPKITGTGVKGQHQRKLLIEEGQDYPEKGWTEVNEAQPVDSPVMTPWGERAMGEIEPGDFVLGGDGTRTEVVGVAEQGKREVLRMHFSDGSWVECDAEHIWTVTCNRHAGRWRQLRAWEIERDVAQDGGFGSRKQPWFVPRQGVANFEESDLPLDPYLLGLLLGDGSLRHGSVTFTTADRELVTAVEERLDADEELIHCERYDYRVRRRAHGSRWRPVPLRDTLMRMGMWGHLAHEKYVPAVYLVAGALHRLELLRGLVDSDGHVNASGAVTFTSSSGRLADAVAWLAWSLGGALRRRVQPDKRGFRDIHVVRFRLPTGMSPAHLARKAIPSTTTVDSMRRAIVGVTREGFKEMKCIAVAAPDGLYMTQDFIVTHNTVNYDSTDADGRPSFRFWIYGVHGGNKGSGFDERARSSVWRKIQVTALMRPDWGKERKENAIAAYGGSSSPDYRRNILGEPGAGASQYFVTSRVMACVDQRIERPPDAKGSHYNVEEYVKETFRFEEMEGMGMRIADVLDLPEGGRYGGIWGGVDIGLTESPTVISLFAEGEWDKKQRLGLIRKFTLERFRPKEIRAALFAIGWHFGPQLLGIGIDITGIGLPLYQDMGDDELAPKHLLDVTVGYTFNSVIPVEVDPKMCTENHGVIRDQYGAMVKREEDEITGEVRFIAMMPFIAASTRELRNEVDSTELLLPFDTEVIGDMLGETKQRVERIGSRVQGSVKKGDRFHILDSFRAMAMRRRSDEITAKLAKPDQKPVLDIAM